MLIEAPEHFNIFGSVKIYDVQKVLKLDSGKVESPLISSISYREIGNVLDRLSIVIPVKNEKTSLLEGVLRAVPQNCQIIVVSNSSREENDKFKLEEKIIKNFNETTKHRLVMIHQKDPALAAAFKKTGYEHIIGSDNLVNDGKAEGMIAGILISKFLEKDFVGFIDADNYIPSVANEYVKDFAAGLLMAKSPYSMVRLHWKYKPKIVGGKFYLKKWGRVSRITNKYMNRLLMSRGGSKKGFIRTANAGEHAISMKLANIMDYSSGYSIEPYQIIYLLENFGYGKIDEDVAKNGIDLFQIETLNPHIHEEKGEKHVESMLLGSLSALYHSSLCGESLKSRMFESLKASGVVDRESQIEKNKIIPSIGNIDVKKFIDVLEKQSDTFSRF